MGWSLVQTKLGSIPVIGSSYSGSVTYSLSFSTPVTAGNVIFIILGLNGGPFIPMISDTKPIDTRGTGYHKYWQSGTGGYPDGTVYAGQLQTSGTCNITFKFDWVVPRNPFPPWAGNVVLLEYSGIPILSGFFSQGLFGILDLARGSFGTIVTGNTVGTNPDGYVPDGDVIVLSYAVNSYTGQLDYRSWIAPGMGIYSYSYPVGAVGSGGYSDFEPLPIYADIMVFGVRHVSGDGGGGEEGAEVGLNQMFIRI